MKKFLLLLFPAAFAISAHAQNTIPNFDMESWNNSTGFYDEPNGWGTFNVLSQTLLGGNPVSCFKDSTNPHAGNYCARIESVALTANPASGTIPDTLGAIWTGAISFISQSATFGYQSTVRPMTFSWWDHYTPMSAGDSGFVLVALTHWNGASTDTLAWAGSIVYNTTSWTPYNTNFYYNPLFPNTIFPDTAVVVASATDDYFPRPGSTLWLDDLSFSGWVGVNEFAADNSVSVFPNPSSTTTNFEVNDANAFEIVVYDMTGREIKRQEIISNKVSIDSYTMAQGVYSYTILSKENSVLSRGKFSVSE
jgi:hypothetical protein